MWWVGVVWCGGCALGLRVRGRRGVWRAGAAPLGSFWGGGMWGGFSWRPQVALAATRGR